MSASNQSDPYADLIAALGGRSISDVVSITGFRLDGSRLYVDEGERSWIDVEDEGILHSRVHSQISTPLGLTTIWVLRTAGVTISQEMDAEDVAAAYLKPTSRGGDTAPGWYRGVEGFVKPSRPSTPTGRGSCFSATSGRAPC